MRNPLAVLLSVIAVGSGLVAAPARAWWCTFNNNNAIFCDKQENKWFDSWVNGATAFIKTPDAQGFMVQGTETPWSDTQNGAGSNKRPDSFSVMFHCDISAMPAPTQNGRILFSVGPTANALSLVQCKSQEGPLGVTLASASTLATRMMLPAPGYHNYIVTYEKKKDGSGVAKLYIDGASTEVAIGSADFDVGTYQHPGRGIQVGSTYEACPPGFERGDFLRVDDIRGFNKVLTPAEVAEVAGYDKFRPRLWLKKREGVDIADNATVWIDLTAEEMAAGKVEIKVGNTQAPKNAVANLNYFDPACGTVAWNAVPPEYEPNADGNGGTVRFSLGGLRSRTAVHGIKFASADPYPQDAGGGIGFVAEGKGGLLPAKDWNHVHGNVSEQPVTLNGSEITVEWTAFGVHAPYGSRVLPNDLLTASWLDNNATKQPSVTLNHLPPCYDVAVIFGGGGGSFSAMTVTADDDPSSAVNYYYTSDRLLDTYTVPDGADAEDEALKHAWGTRGFSHERAEGVNVMYLPNQTAGKLNLRAHKGNAYNKGRGTIAALMIYEHPGFGSISVKDTARWTDVEQKVRDAAVEAGEIYVDFSGADPAMFTFDVEETLPAVIRVKGTGTLHFEALPASGKSVLYADSRVTLSCKEGLEEASVSVLDLTRLIKGTEFKLPAQTLKTSLQGDPTADVYAGGAGTEQLPAQTKLGISDGRLNLGAGRYYLTETMDESGSTVIMTDSSVKYLPRSEGKSGALGIGTADYILAGATRVEAEKVILCQGGYGRTSSLTLKDSASIRVTGNSNVNSQFASVMFGHWNGTSEFNLQGQAKFLAFGADVLIGLSGGSHTVNLEDGIFAVRGLKLSGTDEAAVNLSGKAKVQIAEGGIGSYNQNRVLPIRVTGTPTLQAMAPMTVSGATIHLEAGSELTLDGETSMMTVAAPIAGEGQLVVRGDVILPAGGETHVKNIGDIGQLKLILNRTQYLSGYTSGVPALFFDPNGDPLNTEPTQTYTYSGSLDGSVCLHAYEFNGEVGDAWEDSGAQKKPLTRDLTRPAWAPIDDKSKDSDAEKTAVLVATRPYNNDKFVYPREWSASIAATMPAYPQSVLVAFGAQWGSGALALIKGIGADEVILARNSGNQAYEVLTTMSVPNAVTSRHHYAFVKTPHQVKIYLDGSPWATYTSEAEIAINSGLQLGSLIGNPGNTGYIPLNSMEKTADEPHASIDSLRIFDAPLAPTTITRLAEEFPYVSPNGTYTRKLNGDPAGWDDAGAVWTKVGSDPVETVTSPADGASVILNVAQETHLRISGEVGQSIESMTVNGPGALILGEGGQRIVNLGRTNINTDVTVIPEGFVMNGGPTFVAAGKTLTFDLSSLPVADALRETTLVLTGVVFLGEGAQVKAVLPPIPDGWDVTAAINPQTTRFEVRIAVTGMLSGHVPAGDTDWSGIVWKINDTDVRLPDADYLSRLDEVVLQVADPAVLTCAENLTLKKLTAMSGQAGLTLANGTGTLTASGLNVPSMASVTLKDDAAATLGTLTMHEASHLTAVGTAQYPFGRGNIAVNGTLEYAGTAENAEISGMLSGNGTGVGGLKVTSGVLALTATNGDYEGAIEIGSEATLTNGASTATVPFGKNNTIVNDGMIQLNGNGQLPPVSGPRGALLLGGTARIANDVTARIVHILPDAAPVFAYDKRDFHEEASGDVVVTLTAETLSLKGTLGVGTVTDADSGAAVQGITLKPNVVVNGTLAGNGTLGAGIALALADNAIVDVTDGAPTVAGTLTLNGSVGVSLPENAAAGTVVLNVTGEGVAEALDLTRFSVEGWSVALNEAKNAVVLAEGPVDPPPVDPQPDFVVPGGVTAPSDYEKSVLTEELMKHTDITVRPGQQVMVKVEANGVAVDPAEAYAQASEAVLAFDNVSAVTEESSGLVMHIAYTFAVTKIAFADGQLKVDVAVSRPAPLTRAADPFDGVPQPTFSEYAGLELIDEADRNIGEAFGTAGAGTSAGSVTLANPGATRLFRVRVSLAE